MKHGYKFKAVKKDKPDAWWHKVYVAVVITEIAVIGALSFFTYYFSR